LPFAKSLWALGFTGTRHFWGGFSDQRRGRFFILFAALAWSTAGVMQRGLTVGTPTQLAGRAIFSVVALAGYVAVTNRGRFLSAFLTMGRDGIGVTVLMAVSASAFITALNHTTVANVLFMQALAPILAAGIAAVTLHEHISRRTLLAMVLAVAGVAGMVGAPGHPSLLGEGLAFVMSLSFAGMIVFARRGRDVSMAPATCLSQLLVLLAFAPFAHPGEIGGRDLTLLVALGVFQMALGLVFLSLGARLIPAAEVALISLLEVVLGPLWVWLARGERPAAWSLVGGFVVLVAVVLQVEQPQRE
jgi:drug/metabolite transporter (DMT)-like permease